MITDESLFNQGSYGALFLLVCIVLELKANLKVLLFCRKIQ